MQFMPWSLSWISSDYPFGLNQTKPCPPLMRAEQRTALLIFVLRTAVAWLPLLGCHVSREREQRNMSRWPPNGRNTTSHSPVLGWASGGDGWLGRGASVEGAGSPDDWTASGLQERFGGGGLGVPGEEKHE